MDEPKSPSSMLNTLLIVDDSEMNRAILAEIFKQSYFILEAGDGARACACWKSTAARCAPCFWTCRCP